MSNGNAQQADAGRPDDLPDAAAWGQLRSQLARAGLKQADINAIFGQQVNGRTWRDIAAQAAANLRAMAGSGR